MKNSLYIIQLSLYITQLSSDQNKSSYCNTVTRNNIHNDKLPSIEQSTVSILISRDLLMSKENKNFIPILTKLLQSVCLSSWRWFVLTWRRTLELSS